MLEPFPSVFPTKLIHLYTESLSTESLLVVMEFFPLKYVAVFSSLKELLEK